MEYCKTFACLRLIICRMHLLWKLGWNDRTVGSTRLDEWSSFCNLLCKKGSFILHQDLRSRCFRQVDPFEFSFTPSTLIAATNTIQILLYDVRNMDRPLEIRDSKQKYNLRSICALPHDNGFATGSIEGRVGIDYLHLSDVGFFLSILFSISLLGIPSVLFPMSSSK